MKCKFINMAICEKLMYQQYKKCKCISTTANISVTCEWINGAVWKCKFISSTGNVNVPAVQLGNESVKRKFINRVIVKCRCIHSTGNVNISAAEEIDVYHSRAIALWRKPLTNLELSILPKLWPWLPFSPARIISDIWIFSAFQFHFQFMFGYELKTVFCSSRIGQRISCNSHRLQKGCE